MALCGEAGSRASLPAGPGLSTYLSEVTDRVVSKVLHSDSSEAEVVDAPKGLPRR